MAGLFGFGDFTRPGKGISKDKKESRLQIFFGVLFRKFRQFVTLNILYVICCIPLILGLLLFLPVAAGDDKSHVLNIFIFSVGCLLYVSVVGLAPAATGFTYVLRNYSRQQHAWLFSDFFEHIRNNFKQALTVLVIDIAAAFLGYTNYIFYSTAVQTNAVLSVAQGVFIILAVLYFMMHFYLYQIIVTFKMPLKQIYRTAFVFTIAYLPRNLGILILIVLVAFFSFLSSTTMGIVLSAFLSVSLIGYIVNFLVEPMIQKHTPEENK